MKPLAEDQQSVLRALVRFKGRGRWKGALREIWFSGRVLSDAESALYRLRNTHGPDWLNSITTAEVMSKVKQS